MKGHIRQRSKNSWEIALDIGKDANGNRQQKFHSIKGTKKDAEKELAKLMNSVHTGDYVAPNKMTVGQYLQQWLQDYARSHVSGKTYERYAEIISTHLIPGLGGLPLLKLAPAQINSFYSKALQSGRRDGKPGGLSPQTILHFHRILREALKHAVQLQILVRNPSDAVKPPRVERKKIEPFTEEEIALLLQVTEDAPINLPIILAATTGMRRGEIAALKWDAIDWENGSLAVRESLEETRQGVIFKKPKSGKERSIKLYSLTIEALKRHRVAQAEQRMMLGQNYSNEGLICPQPDGNPWSPMGITHSFEYWVKRSGVRPLPFHNLRHYHATMLMRQKVHPRIVQERLGHSNINITLQTYSHVLPDMQDEAAMLGDQLLRKAIDGSKQG